MELDREYICDNAGARHIRGRIKTPVHRIIKRANRGPAIAWVAPKFHAVRIRDHYWIEVYNARTGRVIYRSDSFGLEDAIEHCHRAVGVARWAWQMDLKRKDLQ